MSSLKKQIKSKEIIGKGSTLGEPNKYYDEEENELQSQESKIDQVNELSQQKTLKLFEDKHFGPSNGWLIAQNLKLENQFQQVSWKRPKEFQNNQEIMLFGENNNLNPENMRQGVLGDCFLVSVLYSLASRPESILSLFGNQPESSSGKYSVKIFVSNKWEDVVVDDRIPVSNVTQKPFFLMHEGGLLWPLLIEKALAKVKGGYSNLQLGSMRDTFIGLTGKPCDSVSLEEMNLDDIWDMIERCLKKGFCLTGGSKKKKEDEINQNETQIENGHAYSLSHTQIEDDKRIIKLWNPWGFKKYSVSKDNQSTENETDQKREEELRETQIQMRKKDGSCLIILEDFKKYFGSVQICMNLDGVNINRYTNTHENNKMVFYKISISSPTQLYLSASISSPSPSLTQGNQFHHQNVGSSFSSSSSISIVPFPDPPSVSSNFSNSNSLLTPSLFKNLDINNSQMKSQQIIGVLAKWEPNEKEYLYIESTQTKENEIILQQVSAKHPLTPGNYVMCIKAKWNDDEIKKKLFITCGGQTTVRIARISPILNFVQSVALSIARKSWRHISPCHWVSIGQIGEGYVFIAAANAQKIVKDEKKKESIEENAFDCKFKIKDMRGLKLKKPFKENKVHFSLQPGQCNVAIIRSKNLKSGMFLKLEQQFQF